MSFQPCLGAWPEKGGIRFRVWAPTAKTVELIIEHSGAEPLVHALQRENGGYFCGWSRDAGCGSRYHYRLDGERSLPDPASRYQPEGVHGPSEVIDPHRFPWTDSHWRGRPLEETILYELHIGTFTPEGTFAGATKKLPFLKELGVTAIELMPVADFPGSRNWGYDGVDLFAPARCYGTPDDFRRLIDAAHKLELAVFLDVVYNHLGPEGAYLGSFSPRYFSPKHKSPWGDAVNLDDKDCVHARNFFIENALHWIHEYHIDGLRLDATHALVDDSPMHFLRELAERVRESIPRHRNVLVIAEDDRNECRLILPSKNDGFGLDGVWADDFHHQVRSMLAGDDDGYYQDFTGSIEDLAATMTQGWFYTGQQSRFRKTPRGSDPGGIPLPRFIYCIQNHDQIGNRAMGDRLNTAVDLASYRAASALLLFSPATPLLFMGQEWAATTPFCYFTDHPPELGKLVTQGRRKEFQHFKAFRDPASWETIPDPQSPETYEQSRLDWEEPKRSPHSNILQLYKTLLSLRKAEPVLATGPESQCEVTVVGEFTLALMRKRSDCSPLMGIFCLKGESTVNLEKIFTGPSSDIPAFQILLNTEDRVFGGSSSTPVSGIAPNNLRFSGPGAIILKTV